MKYLKKPIEVEAFKWTGGVDQEEDPVWIDDAIKQGIVYFRNELTEHLKLIIDKGYKEIEIVSPGDYIIKESNGKIYSCKPDIFKEMFELAL